MSTTRPQAQPTVLIDDERTIATEWRFPPGGETGWHKHGHDYVVVPMSTGKLLLEEPGGTSRTADLATGKPYARSAGVEHNVVNANDFEFVFIEIELKR